MHLASYFTVVLPLGINDFFPKMQIAVETTNFFANPHFPKAPVHTRTLEWSEVNNIIMCATLPANVC